LLRFHLDGTCYHIKLNEHVPREVLARPEFVQIETAFRNPKERQPEALSRNEYTVVDVPKDENEEPEPVTLPLPRSQHFQASCVHPEDHGEGEEMGRAIASLLRPLVILPSNLWVTLQGF
jgi:hypothetical protein